MDPLYLCIDLKSFYASVECAERGLDPMTTNLVVADPTRTDKTICLAVSPSMKALGVKNRCRVFEIPKTIDYIMAPPRMQKYIDYAAGIYEIYLRRFSEEDVFVYSIDEAFLNVAPYLKACGMTGREMALSLMNEILDRFGVRATCGMGTNLYLCKVALDILAKHAKDYIAFLNEEGYRRALWDHQPLTDFWRIGVGTARRLASHGIYTMEQVARADEDWLYRTFGIDAELLIDHAWGREPTTLEDVRAYCPRTRCLSSSEVLWRDYFFEEARLIVREMAEQMCLDLVAKGAVSDSLSLWVGYSNALHVRPSAGSLTLSRPASADSTILPAFDRLFLRIVDPEKPVRRISLGLGNLQSREPQTQQTDFLPGTQKDASEDENHRAQQAILAIRQKYGKNALFRAMDLTEAATTRERNRQIGGHRDGSEAIDARQSAGQTVHALRGDQGSRRGAGTEKAGAAPSAPAAPLRGGVKGAGQSAAPAEKGHVGTSEPV